MRENLLFHRNGELRIHLDRIFTELKNEIWSMDEDYFLTVDESELFRHLVSKYALESPILHDDMICVHEQREIDIDVSQDPCRMVFDRGRPCYVKGIAVTVALPFEGDRNLFQFTPSSFTYSPPRGEIVDPEIHLTYEEIEHSSDKLKQTYTHDVELVKRYVGWIKNDVDTFNKSLEQNIRKLIQLRKEKLKSAHGVLSELGIPIRRREGAPVTYATPAIRRKAPIERPVVKGSKLDPSFPQKEYEHVLHIIQNMVLVMERSPRAFIDMKEEDLRQHFLVQLNAQYEGQATGETFNYEGKTDILVRGDGKNIFIAECKFWQGEKELVKAIDQLLSYTSWRDTKAAILLFNRQKDFTAVLQKVPDIVKSHPCYKGELGREAETIFHYLFHQRDDAEREVILAIMVFNIPK